MWMLNARSKYLEYSSWIRNTEMGMSSQYSATIMQNMQSLNKQNVYIEKYKISSDRPYINLRGNSRMETA
jgi:hypothetical protein